jgi:sirohydrochlorin cobaltochelatase
LNKEFIVLAAHGSPPMDFPRTELAEFFGLHSQIEGGEKLPEDLAGRYQGLERKMRQWPRSHTNDPYYTATIELADKLKQQTGRQVVVGFNEFCGPEVGHAIEMAVEQGASRITVITPMLTRGGHHAEVEIRHIVDDARARHTGVEMVYAWPFDSGAIARFLAEQVTGFSPEKD